MASTYSNNLRLELMATGENRSTWGTKANNVFNMIEDAIAGMATVDMANTNKTLTSVNGNEDQARCAIITLTGANTAVRTLTIPTVSKIYVIRNNTSGGFAVTISNGSSTTSIATGTWAIVWTDGTTLFNQSASNFALITDVDDLSGVTNAFAARANLGLGTMATQNAGAVEITGGTMSGVSATLSPALPIGSGGTGGTTAAAARANLGLGDISVVPTGAILPFAGSVAPDGYLLCAGQLVNRTTYASLFSVIGITYSAGNGTTTFGLPDLRGRVPAGKDNMNGTAAGRLSSTISGTSMGAGGGSETVVLTEANLAAHDHTISIAAGGAHTHTFSDTATTTSAGAHTHTVPYTAGTSGSGSPTGDATATTTVTTNSAGAHTHSVTVSGTTSASATHTHSATIGNAGSGTAHSNLQPTVILNYIIRT